MKDFLREYRNGGNGNENLRKCVRIFPHKMNGEGHFLALMKKQGQPDMVQQHLLSARMPTPENGWSFSLRKSVYRPWVEKPLTGTGWRQEETRSIISLPVNTGFRGLTFLRNGLYLGDLKKNRFEPSQPFALALYKNDVKAVISLPVADSRLTRYLKGETLLIEEGEARGKKRLASSLCRGIPTWLWQAGKRYSEKQISCRLGESE